MLMLMLWARELTGVHLEGVWSLLMVGIVSAVATFPARVAARWLVQRYPTTAATYD